MGDQQLREDLVEVLAAVGRGEVARYRRNSVTPLESGEDIWVQPGAGGRHRRVSRKLAALRGRRPPLVAWEPPDQTGQPYEVLLDEWPWQLTDAGSQSLIELLEGGGHEWLNRSDTYAAGSTASRRSRARSSARTTPGSGWSSSGATTPA